MAVSALVPVVVFADVVVVVGAALEAGVGGHRCLAWQSVTGDVFQLPKVFAPASKSALISHKQETVSYEHE